MTYQEAEEYIFSIPKFTKKNDPESTGEFYERLGKPGENSKIVHIAGTNGKGSVCAYLNAILETAGHRTGMFTSPHLVSMLERFRIAGQIVTEELFLRSFRFVMKKILEWNEEGRAYHPTFFEILFFIGMVIFEEQKVEFIILETGLGGRLDATNIIKNPIATVITKIGLDHCEYLGDTLEKIAGEKAGIIKRGIPVIFLNVKEEVTRVIETEAKKLQSPTFPVDSNNFNILKNTYKSIDFSLESKYYGYIRLTLSSCALYQMMNAALAVRTVEVIDEAHTITKEQLVKGVASTRWEGRMEEILPGVIVEGAHNVDGIEAFVDTLKSMNCRNNHLLFAVVNDKDYAAMIRRLMESGLFTRVSVTKIQGSRVVELEQLKKIFSQYTKELYLYEDVDEAFRDCLQQKGKEDRLYIVGSLYLVGLVKEILRR